MAASKNQGIKLAVALALLVAAGVIVAWTQGAFSSSPPPAALTPEEIKASDDARKQIELKQKSGVIQQSPST
jgi:hypothetical protein